MIADTSTPSASRRAGLADPWAWLCAFAPLVLFAGTRGAARGEPVAEDFDFLRRALLEPHTWWDGGGSLSFWRPVSHQLYYDVLGRLMLTHPLAVSALHGVLLAVATVLLYRLLRGPLGSPLAAAAATFPLLSESTRTLVCWPSHFVDLGVYLFSVLALSEAAARRLPTALAALLAALLCKEVAVVTALLMPFLPGFERPRRVRWAIATALLLAAWAAAYIAVRRHAGLELPHGLEHDPAVRAIGPVSRFGWALWNSVRAIFSLSLRPGPFDGLAAISVGLLATGVAVGLRGAAARARVAATRAWMAWGAAWFLLASATLTSIFPLWSPNRSQFGSAGFGIAATALAGAVHPGLAGLLTGSRLTMFALAPRVPTRISPEPEERGAFIDVPRLTRLQRLMSTARHALLARHPTLAHGDVVVFHNLPLSAEYAFGGPHAVQVWYRDTTLRCVSFDAFKKDSLLRAVALISYQPPPRPADRDPRTGGDPPPARGRRGVVRVRLAAGAARVRRRRLGATRPARRRFRGRQRGSPRLRARGPRAVRPGRIRGATRARDRDRGRGRPLRAGAGARPPPRAGRGARPARHGADARSRQRGRDRAARPDRRGAAGALGRVLHEP